MEKYIRNGKRLHRALRVLCIVAGFFAACVIAYIGWTVYR